MNYPLISVVIPAYNAGKYIAKAIESVLLQAFTDWELVIVDDCSSDDTLKIARKYEQQDSRVRVFSLDVNSGSAYLPRKKAIELSRSAWIVTLDADDFLEIEDLKKLWERQSETHADIVLHQLVSVSEDGKVIQEGYVCPPSSFDFDVILSGKEACSLTIGTWILNGNGLFLKKLYFQVWKECYGDVGMNGDELLTRQLFLQAKTVALCTAKYFYRNNSQSITRKFSIKLFDVLQTNTDLKKLVWLHYGENSIEARNMALQQMNGLLHCTQLLYNAKNSIPLDTRNTVEKKIHEAWKDIDWNILKFSPKYKIYSYLLSLNFHLYKIMIKGWMYVKRIRQL